MLPTKTFLTTQGDTLEITLIDGMPTLSTAAGPLILACRFDPAEFREFGRAMVTMADRAEGREAARDAQLILLALVDAIEHADLGERHEARLRPHLDAARAFRERVPA